MSINFYNTIHKKNKITNPHYDKHNIDIPFRMIIASPSGSGKTHQLCRLIYEFGKTWHEIYICALSADEPLYEMIEQRLKDNIFIFEKGEIPPLDNFYTTDAKTNRIKRKDNKQRLIVFDDLMLHKKANSIIEEYYIKGRKVGFSSIYISQNFYHIPRNVRLNSQYFILGRNILSRDIKDILRIFSIDMDVKTFSEIYNTLTQNPLDCILINVDKKIITKNIVEDKFNVSNKKNIIETINKINNDYGSLSDNN